MKTITTTLHFEHEEGKPVLCCKVLDSSWTVTEQNHLFAELSESLLECSYSLLCYDLSSLQVVNSNTFGICFNLIQKSQKSGKKIKFRFNKDVAYVAKIANMHRHVAIEEVVASI